MGACLALQIFVTAFSLYEIATQVFPYRELRAMEVVYCVIVKSTRPQIPLDCNISSDYYNLMTSCWSQTPDDRPSFSEIVCKLEQMLDSVDAFGSDSKSYHDEDVLTLYDSELSVNSERSK